MHNIIFPQIVKSSYNLIHDWHGLFLRNRSVSLNHVSEALAGTEFHYEINVIILLNYFIALNNISIFKLNNELHLRLWLLLLFYMVKLCRLLYLSNRHVFGIVSEYLAYVNNCKIASSNHWDLEIEIFGFIIDWKDDLFLEFHYKNY